MRYYDWNTTFSKDALVNIIVAARGVGKTYGFRRAAVNNYLKRGLRFVEVCRTKAERKNVAPDYFGKLVEQEEFPGHVFKTDTGRAYIARKPEGAEKPQWEVIGYFVALTEALVTKKKTYVNVDRLMFDEGIIDKSISPYARYLPNEIGILSNVVDSCTREDGEHGRTPHLYICANAVDFLNPYFETFGVDTVPRHGYTWYAGKRVLVHYPKPDSERLEKRRGRTLAGFLADKSGQGGTSLDNVFKVQASDLIADKPSEAKYRWCFTFAGKSVAVWESKGTYYLSSKVPAAATAWAITNDDESVNTRLATRANPLMRRLAEARHLGLVRYESPWVRDVYLDAARVCGRLG